MKNIHILPTDKPSKLYYFTTNKAGYYLYPNNELVIPINPNCQNQNIYITNDEEIKEDWTFDQDLFLSKIDKEQLEDNSKETIQGMYKKIILTTDQDLIKDGVQAISDEFLEWFVKNPNCEEVDIKRNKKLSKKSIWNAKEGDLVFNNHNNGGVIAQLSDDIRVHIISENGEGYMEIAQTSDNGIDTLVINNYKVYEYSDYKIIIPKEEPKQLFTKGDEVLFTGKMLDEEVIDKLVTVFYTLGKGELDDMSDIMDEYTHIYRVWNKNLKHILKKEPKQEIEKGVECNTCGNLMSLKKDKSIYICTNSERSYSEEEVKSMLQKRLQSVGIFSSEKATEVWFKQYKKQ